MEYKLRLLHFQSIESMHDIKKLKPVQTDTWNYDNISSIIRKLSPASANMNFVKKKIYG